MKKVVLIATVLLAITSMLVIVSQSAGAPSVQPADAVEGEGRSAEYWLDNQADAQVFMEAYSLTSSPVAHWVPDYPEDARLYMRVPGGYPARYAPLDPRFPAGRESIF